MRHVRDTMETEAWVFGSTTSLENDPRLLLSGFFFGARPFPVEILVLAHDQRPDRERVQHRRWSGTWPLARAPITRSYTPGQWEREGDESVSKYFPTGMISVRNRLECRQQ